MDRLSVRQFRESWTTIQEPVIVEARGRPVGIWTPTGAGPIDTVRHSLDKVRVEEEEPIRPVANGTRPARGKVIPDKLPTVFRADKVGAGFGTSRPAPKR